MLFGILWCDCLCWSVSIWLLEQMNKLLHDIRQVRILAPYQEGLRMQRWLHDGLADHAVVHVLDGCGIGGDRHTDAGFRPADGGRRLCILADNVRRESLLAAGIHNQVVVTAVNNQRLTLQLCQIDFIPGDTLEEIRQADSCECICCFLRSVLPADGERVI